MPVPTAVLFSAGLDSAVLLAEEAARGEVQPVYVSTGLIWESAERDMVGRLLASPAFAGVRRPLASLTVDMRDVYASSHWAIAGDAPAYHTPDEDVYLVGRNIVLLGKAAVHCAPAGLGRIVLGTLAHNPFPDATPEFRAAMTEALTLGLGSPIQIDAPYADVGKAEIVRRGMALHIPFELTLSCMQPILEEGTMARHCGTCSKCRERHEAFLQAKAEDPTIYVDTRFVSRSAQR